MPFPTVSLSTLGLGAHALLACACAVLGFVVATLRPFAPPTLGRRGMRRHRALTESHFRVVEPAIRFVAAVLQPLCPVRLRERLDTSLARGGDFLGFCAEELLAASALSGLAGLAICKLADEWLTAPFWLLALPIGCASLPFLALDQHRRARVRLITRRLPAMIDLLALAMNAGLDFAASIELVVREVGLPDDPLTEELYVLLHELSLGHPRRRALATLAERTDAPAIFELTSAVIQGEQKGTPLASILETQAQVSRNRRSVLAEEAAARAAVLLMLPLVLLLGAVMLVLFGPFLIGGFSL